MEKNDMQRQKKWMGKTKIITEYRQTDGDADAGGMRTV